MRYIISNHAKLELDRRGLSEGLVDAVMLNPEQVVSGTNQRRIYQSRIKESGKVYLIRLIVDVRAFPPVIVTAYRTSKIEKYWSTP